MTFCEVYNTWSCYNCTTNPIRLFCVPRWLVLCRLPWELLAVLKVRWFEAQCPHISWEIAVCVLVCVRVKERRSSMAWLVSGVVHYDISRQYGFIWKPYTDAKQSVNWFFCSSSNCSNKEVRIDLSCWLLICMYVCLVTHLFVFKCVTSSHFTDINLKKKNSRYICKCIFLDWNIVILQIYLRKMSKIYWWKIYLHKL